MESLLKLVRNIWVQRSALLLFGSAAGYAYYVTIGCDGGCPLTGNPWSSTVYGAVVGLLLHPGRWIQRSAKPDTVSTGSTKD